MHLTCWTPGCCCPSRPVQALDPDITSLPLVPVSHSPPPHTPEQVLDPDRHQNTAFPLPSHPCAGARPHTPSSHRCAGA